MVNFLKLKKVTLLNGETIAYRESGEGEKTLLLIHGNMTSSRHWDILTEKIKEKYKILAVDMRGFGQSSYNSPINSLNDFAKDIEELLDILKVDICSAIGWSTGGGVALELAANIPEKIEKVILLESVGVKGYPIFKKDSNGQPTDELLKTKNEIAEDPIQVKPVLNALAAKNKEFYRKLWNMAIYTHNKPNDELYEEYLDDMLTQRNLVDVDYALVYFNITNESNGVNNGSDKCKLVKAPVLILQGNHDYVVPMSMAEDTNKFIGNSRIVVLNSGHSPMIDCMNTLIEEIYDFI
ncbi:intracellular short-chain-length polyhydroxyalkanoate depolymerase [Clostridium tertium]|uniref:intracellular short-chain-length polyhydroxyalkanoate depolymerase n=1 Tax=Clostridium tertium TaxID=1559 RepID=UPI001AE7959D|nr:alpha/beta hydrolase [Clostridium tertium]MBP1867640.1 pimeloyl-ACP methyl ester carboxylesterase [Clostridium tertium]